MTIVAATVTDLSRVVPLSEQLTASYLEYAGVLPLECRDGVLRLATWRDSVDEQVLDDLRVWPKTAGEQDALTCAVHVLRASQQKLIQVVPLDRVSRILFLASESKSLTQRRREN